ncbi:MAG TPA: efflux RND transporter periplasmic adaptor subunit [Pirellulales bacterium]|jgi:multidrug resistance efflux pump|nr:efflux RND transporter periplasmic adaptor subunit [Pirellulales bacterium]
MLTRVLLPLVAAGLLIYSVVHMLNSDPLTPDAQPTLEPSHNPYASSVAGPGVVEAAAENIAIGSPVPGVVVEVFAKVGMKLKPGSKLFRLDDRQLQADLGFRKAAVEAAKAELERLENQPRPEEVRMSQSLLDEALANMTEQKDQLARIKDLHEQKFSTHMEYVTRQQAYQTAKAKYDHAKAEFEMREQGAWKFDKLVSKTAVLQAETQVRQVETEIERLTICSQAEGEVLQVNVRPGEFVGTPPGQPLVVVGDVGKLHVRVDIDEYDIPRFQPGAPAKATLKGQPREQFALSFVRVEPFVVPKKSLTGENTERVDTRVLPVIFELHAGDRQFFVGQQLDVYIEAQLPEVPSPTGRSPEKTPSAPADPLTDGQPEEAASAK